MTDKEIERQRERLVKIIGNSDSEHRKHTALRELGKEVGVIASLSLYVNNEGGTTSVELAGRIQTALQTATMINMCKTASRNYKIALVAAIAAWAAVLAMVLIAVLTR